ncbi:MAG: DUF2218 domain-containing protein [Alphaproteobacteria bacterium]|nr:MAG: DUF2218 domain-containing protein [Alphaproteobacteria bacterium]
MTFNATAHVPTPNASKYLQQLCKHWQHNLQVEFTPDAGTVVFPKDARGADWPAAALLSLGASDRTLICRLAASAPEQLDALKGAVERHVNRFAFREGDLAFDWEGDDL